MINKLPVVGWLLSVAANASAAVPFWIIWVRLGVGARLFPMLPPQWLQFGLLDCVGLFVCLSVLTAFSPLRASASAEATVKPKAAREP